MFTLLGALLTIYGVFTNADAALYSRSLGVNINLWSGLGMLLFGLIMLVFAFRTHQSKKR